MEFPNNGDSSDPELVIPRPEMYKKCNGIIQNCVFFAKKTFCEEKIGEFPVIRPESTPEDSPEPHSGALPGKCAHAGKVPKYQNFQSWGIPKEDSSSNYRRAEDREAFSKSRIRRLPAPAVPPL